MFFLLIITNIVEKVVPLPYEETKKNVSSKLYIHH